jgi:hypothetical protein
VQVRGALRQQELSQFIKAHIGGGTRARATTLALGALLFRDAATTGARRHTHEDGGGGGGGEAVAGGSVAGQPLASRQHGPELKVDLVNVASIVACLEMEIIHGTYD